MSPVTGKRPRTEDASSNAGPSQNKARLEEEDIKDGKQLAGLFNTTSLDQIRAALSSLAFATRVGRYDHRIEANDRRIKVAKDFVQAGGLGHKHGEGSRPSGRSNASLLNAWSLAHEQDKTLLLTLTLSCLANIIFCLGAHQPDYEDAEIILRPLLPIRSSAQEQEQSELWSRLLGYLARLDNAKDNKKGKGHPRAGSGGSAEALALSTLRLLLSMTNFAGSKYARIICESLPWGARHMQRLPSIRRRIKDFHAKQGGRSNSKGRSGSSMEQPDIRTVYIFLLLSFLRPASGGCTPAALRISALSIASDHYQGLFKGLLQDPAPIVAHILVCLYDGLLSEEASLKMPRSRTFSLFSEHTCKNLLLLYDREEDVIHLAQSDEERSISDVVHHFMLGLCTHTGMGICHTDNGWYGRHTSTDDDQSVDTIHFRDTEKAALHNKTLFSILKALSPSKSPKQAELAIRIVGAAPELAGPYMNSLQSVDPRPKSLSWLGTAAFLNRLLSIPLPSFTRDGRFLPSPPPLEQCSKALLPRWANKSTLTRGIQLKDRLSCLASLILTAHLTRRLLAFRSVCRKATDDLQGSGVKAEQKEDDLRNDAEDVLTGRFGEQKKATSEWWRCWLMLSQQAREQLPDFSSILAALLQGYQSAAKDDINSSSTNQHYQVVLMEAALRNCWQHMQLFDEEALLVPADAEKLLNAVILGPADLSESEGSDSMMELCRLHAMRIVMAHASSQGGGSDLLTKVSASQQSSLRQILDLQSNKSSAMLRDAARGLLSSLMVRSVLFEHDANEWEAWQFALVKTSQSLFDFLDECMQRCLKTPYRYIELARQSTAECAEAELAESLLSPLLHVMLEQFTIRVSKGLFSKQDLILLDFLHFLDRLFSAMLVMGKPSSLLELLWKQVESEVRSSEVVQTTHTTLRSSLIPAPTFSNSVNSAIEYPEKSIVTSKRESAIDQVDSPIEAKLKFRLALTQLWSDPQLTTEDELYQALLRGATDAPFLQYALSVGEKSSKELESNQEKLGFLVRMLTRGPFDPDLIDISRLSAPVIEAVVARFKETRSIEDYRLAVDMAPFMQSELRQQLMTALLSDATLFALAMRVAETCGSTQHTVQDLCVVSRSVKKWSDESVTALIALIEVAEPVEPSIADLQFMADLFIARYMKAMDADDHIAKILKRFPTFSLVFLKSLHEKSGLEQAFEILPCAIFAAISEAAAELQSEVRQALIKSCLAHLFDDAATISSTAAQVLARILETDQGASFEYLPVSIIPKAPAKAFKASSLQLALFLTDLPQISESVLPFSSLLIEKSLLWLVRRFAEDEQDSDETIEAIKAVTSILERTPRLIDNLSHLAEPVLIAAVQRRLSGAEHARLVQVLLPHANLKISSARQLVSDILRQHEALTNDSVRKSMINLVAQLVEIEPAFLDQALIQELLPFYSGGLDLQDRQIFRIFSQYEYATQRSVLSILTIWTGRGNGIFTSEIEAGSDIVWRLDSARILETCLKFPRARSFSNLKATGYGAAIQARAVPRIYDPLLLLGIFGDFLSRDGPASGVQWNALLRSNLPGFAACCLSSQCDPVRRSALTITALMYDKIRAADFHEKEQVSLLMDSLRQAIARGSQGNSPSSISPLPLTATIFATHTFRSIAQPTSYLYPLTSRFLLQRASPLDPTDIPLLYEFLFASSFQSSTHRQQRLFILRFLTTCLQYGGQQEWRIMKKRHVWSLICSLYLSSIVQNPVDVSTQVAIEAFWHAALTHKRIAMDAISRTGFLNLLQQIMSLNEAFFQSNGPFWADIICLLGEEAELERLPADKAQLFSTSLCMLLTHLARSESLKTLFASEQRSSSEVLFERLTSVLKRLAQQAADCTLEASSRELTSQASALLLLRHAAN